MGKRFLVVDDEPLVRRVITRLLETLGGEVVAVGSGEEALARVEGEHFDAALLDAFLPGLDGSAVLERLRVSRSKLPVVIVSGGGADPSSFAGAAAMLLKPVSGGDLGAVLADVLSR